MSPVGAASAAIEDRAGSAATDAERRAVFGEILGLDGPVAQPVLLAALVDEAYARNLLVSRHDPALRDYLLEHPPKVAVRSSPSNRALLEKAASSLVSWARTGFSTVDPDLLKRREDACLACPNLATPSRLLQKTMAQDGASGNVGKRTGDKVCDLCGCNVGRKIRLTSESCPGEDPGNPGQTRWGEPISAGA